MERSDPQRLATPPKPPFQPAPGKRVLYAMALASETVPAVRQGSQHVVSGKVPRLQQALMIRFNWEKGANAAEVAREDTVNGDEEGGSEEARDATGTNFHSVRSSFQQLVHNHASFVRSVVEIPEGVRTITLTSDPELLKVLRKHPTEIRQYLDGGGHVRMWDPLFAEMILQKDHIQMEIQEIQNGVEVTLKADGPEVVKLVRAHAAKVSDMVQRGPESAHEETPLPEGYVAPDD